MTDETTPRTDAFFGTQAIGDRQVRGDKSSREFARQLERELAQSKREAYEEAAMVCDTLWEKNNSFAYHFEIERTKQVQRAAVYRTCVEAIRKLELREGCSSLVTSTAPSQPERELPEELEAVEWLRSVIQDCPTGVSRSKEIIRHIDTLRTLYDAALREREETAELHRMQMAGISVVLLCNTRESLAAQAIERDNPYWTPAYQDAVTTILREISERERAEASVEQMREELVAHKVDESTGLTYRMLDAAAAKQRELDERLKEAHACIRDAPTFTLDERIINRWKQKHAAPIARSQHE